MPKSKKQTTQCFDPVHATRNQRDSATPHTLNIPLVESMELIDQPVYTKTKKQTYAQRNQKKLEAIRVRRSDPILQQKEKKNRRVRDQKNIKGKLYKIDIKIFNETEIPLKMLLRNQENDDIKSSNINKTIVKTNRTKKRKQTYAQRNQKKLEAIRARRSDLVLKEKKRNDSKVQDQKKIKRKFCETNIEKLTENEIPLTILLPKRKTTDASITDDLNSSKINNLITASNNIQSYTDTNKKSNQDIAFNVVTSDIFPEFIFGDFSQFSNEFPKPHHQCTAMAATALAYAFVKLVTSWNANDVNNILRTGQTYYKNCISHVLSINPEYDSTYLEALHLIPYLKINSGEIHVYIHSMNSFGGLLNREVFTEAINNFEQGGFTSGIITYIDFSYGLLRLRGTGSSSFYAFFDSHGRKNNGRKDGPRAAILFFKDASDFIDFFLKENPKFKSKTNNTYDLFKNFILVPLDFIDVTNEGTENCISNYDRLLWSDEIEQDSNDHSNSCLCFSVIAIVYAKINCINNWKKTDLQSIFSYGQSYSRASYNKTIMNGSNEMNLSVVDLIDTIQINEDTYYIYIQNPNIGPVRTLVDTFQFLTALQYFFSSTYRFSILTIGKCSYAIIKCDNNSQLAFYDIHGRDNNDRKCGSYSTVFYFISCTQIINFILSEIKGQNLFSFDIIIINKEDSKNPPQIESTIFTKAISESFTENDICNDNKIDKQSTVSNSVQSIDISLIPNSNKSTPLFSSTITESNKISNKEPSVSIKQVTLSKKEKNRLKVQKHRLNMTKEARNEVNMKNAERNRQTRKDKTEDRYYENNAKRNMSNFSDAKIRHAKLNYEWPAAIPKCIKEKCLSDFNTKMSKKELFQKTCSICNRTDFNKNFNEMKFSKINSLVGTLLKPNKELYNIISGVQENLEDSNMKIDIEQEINHEKTQSNTKFKMTENTYKNNNIEIAPEVIICEDMNSHFDDEQIKISKINGTKNLINRDQEIMQIKIQNINNNYESNKKSYFCYKNTLLYKNGIDLETSPMNDDKICNICSNCFSSLNKKKPTTPHFSGVNDCFIGDIPEELKNLTIPEEQLISLYRHNKCVIKMQARSYDASTKQSKISGNVIVFQQNVSSIATVLPLPPNSLCDSIKVVFVGSNPPSRVESKRLLTVRRDKVFKALKWLINNNPLYKDIKLSNTNILNLPIDDIPDSLWITMDLTTNIEAANASRSGYAEEPCISDSVLENVFDSLKTSHEETSANPEEKTLIAMSTSALVDVDNVDTSANEIQNHLLNNILFENKEMKKHTEKTYYMIPHSEKPVNQYDNPLLLLGLFPTLFPYGLGDPTNSNRKVKTHYKKHLQYLLSYHDKRFEKHYSFIFVVFNMLQRRNACYNAKLMMNQPYSHSYAKSISNVKASDVESALKVIAQKGKDTYIQINSDVKRLVKQVKAVGGNVPGSVQARSKLRTDIHSLIYRKGLPSIFITINPADTHSPIALVIAGVDVDMEKIIKETFPSGYSRAQIIASHPVSTAKFFNHLIKTIISTLIMGGVLGPMDSYFGTVESQGRGSLHLHMLLWLDHKMKPKELREKIENPDFRTRLLRYLEDIVKESLEEFTGECNDIDSESTDATHQDLLLDKEKSIKEILKYVKDDLPAACLLTPNLNDLDYEINFRKDIINLVTESNTHRHNSTCYKYSKVNDKHPVCRMRFPRAKVEKSSINAETGEIKLKRTNEWLNNFNETIISACRCNMDIKYIFSGKDAKALCYYITDYVTKSSLSFYDIFSLIHTAVKLVEDGPQINTDQENDMIERSRRLILKAYNTIASKSELSGVQVASYLMNWEDHYTNQTFSNIFVIGIERYLQTGLDRIRSIKDNDEEKEKRNIKNIVEDDENDLTPDEEAREINMNDEQFELELDDDKKDFILVNQRVDYENRPEELNDICLYFFVAKYKKKKKEKIDEEYLIVQNTEECDLPKKERGRPAQKRFIFEANHPQQTTHILMKRGTEIIPVLVGPQIPRKEREVTKERYCRSILSLFKPWRTVMDLCSPNESWIEAWEKSQTYLYNSEGREIIENIELLHECKEHKNEHLIQVIEQLENSNAEPPFYARLNDESESEDETDEQLSNLIDMLDTLGEDNTFDDKDFVHSSLEALSKTNRFQINKKKDADLQPEIFIDNLNDNEIDEIRSKKRYPNIKSLIPATSILLSRNNEWQLCLKIEREKLRKEVLYGTLEENGDSNTTKRNYVDDIESRNIVVSEGPEVVVGTIDVTTQESIIAKYSLNKAQRRAFMIVTDHLEGKSFLNSNETKQPQLIMCIPATAGTGKSHLNKALTEYFEVTGRLSILRKLAPTSIAANEMGDGGLTMQSFLHGRLPKKMTQNRKSIIEKEWKHIKYIFLDEVSMIGLDTIARLSRLLSLTKEDWADTTDPFGGKNIVFFGDIIQYKPIMDRPVYSNMLDPGDQFKNNKEMLIQYVDQHEKAMELEEKAAEEKIQEKRNAKKENREISVLPKINNLLIRQKVGRALWMQINVVVVLEEQMRTTDRRLLDIQNRIREGKVTEEDHKELSKRVVKIGNELESLTESPWNSAPVIVFRNDLRTTINHKAVAHKAMENEVPLIVCVANDTFSISSNKKNQIGRYFLSLDDNKTQNLPGYLPLVAGMPVALTRSLHTELGLSNGTIGIFRQLIYDDTNDIEDELIDKRKFLKNTIYIRKPVCALIELIDPKKCPKLKNLPPKIVPIPVDTQEFYIDISKMFPQNVKKQLIKTAAIKVTRKQIPLIPAYSSTSHKSQGQTIQNAVLDLEFPPPPFSKETATVFVPITRVKLMENLAFYREFPISVLRIPPSKEQKTEINRLADLNEKTIKLFETQYPNSY